MAGLWQVTIPQSSTVPNLDCNPSFEISACPGNTTGSAGCTAGAGTLAMDQTYQHWGLQAAKYTPSAAAYDGFFKTYVLTSGSTYYFSCDFSGSLGVPYVAYFATTGSALVGTAGSVAGTGAWVANRPVATYTAGSTGAYRVYVAKNNSADTQPFWVDGCLLTTSGSTIVYLDGDQPNCYWAGYAQGSVSYGQAYSYNVGQLANLTDDLGIPVKGWSGAGLPTLSNIFVEYGLTDGSYYQRTKAQARAVDFTLQFPGTSLADMHARRNRLEKIVRYDATLQPQPRRYRYLGGTRPVSLEAVYDAGLEGNYQEGQGFQEVDGMRVIASDPYWYEDGNSAAALNLYATLSVSSDSTAFYQRDLTGAWSLTGQVDGAVNRMIFDPLTKRIYAAGSWGGAMPYCMFWDGAQWNATGAGPGVPVTDMAVDASGILWVTTTGSSAQAATYVKWWSGSAGWNTAGSCPGSAVVLNNLNSITVATNGDIYVAGAFYGSGSSGRMINGVGTTSGSYALRYVPTSGSWYSIGAEGKLSAIATGNGGNACLLTGMDKNIYVGGSGSPGGLWRYVPTSGSWTLLGQLKGNANSAFINRIVQSADGTLFVFGSFLGIGNVESGLSVGAVYYNGTAFYPMGTGIYAPSNATVADAVLMADGTVEVSGNYTSINGLTNSGIMGWNGSTWVYDDGNILNALLATTPQGLFYVAGTSASTGKPTAITNAGTTNTYAVITLTGPGTVYKIKNYTTGDSAYLNLTLLVGEVATLTLSQFGITFTSNFRGNILGTVLPPPPPIFRLVAGVNSLVCYVLPAGGGQPVAAAAWRVRHLDQDGPNI